MQRTLRLLFVFTLVGSVLAATLGALPRSWAAAPVAEPEIQTKGPVGDYLHHGIKLWVDTFDAPQVRRYLQ